MDFNSLKDSVSNLTLYDLKAGVRKVQNAVMNYTEMEAKVREATNNEPWGASSTVMQEIANGTFNYQTLNEIMPMIYRRFTEKSAEEWRQIYKALQLLEFLIKHGSERVIDDARSHITLLKMLRQFHFIDPSGKDQGVNVRNRAKELAELLSDVDKIRLERKKARATKNKYTGVEGGTSFAGGGFSSGSGGTGRYGGFGSETAMGGSSRDFGGYSGGVYGDGGGFGGESSEWREGGRSNKFEEYDEFDEDERPAASRTKRAEKAPAKKAEPPKKKAPEVDLFSFDEPETPSAAVAAPVSSSGMAALSTPAKTDDDDDFDDFQSAAPSQPTQPLSPPLMTSTATNATFAAPQPVSAPKQANLNEMVNLSSISPAPSSNATPGANYSALGAAPSAQHPTSGGFQQSGPNYFQAVPAAQVQPGMARTMSGMSSGSAMAAAKPASTAPTATSSGGDAFGALWSQASVGIKKTGTPSGSGPAMGQLAKEKSAAGIWGAPSQGSSGAGGGAKPGGGAMGDLLG